MYYQKLEEVRLELKTINHQGLIDMSKKTMGPTFSDDSIIREMCMKLSNNFHMGLISLNGLLLEEITSRFEQELKDIGRL